MHACLCLRTANMIGKRCGCVKRHITPRQRVQASQLSVKEIISDLIRSGFCSSHYYAFFTILSDMVLYHAEMLFF